MSEVKCGTVDWENPFVLDDFDSLPLENGAIKILVAGEALRAANKRFHELIGAAPVLYGVDGKYWSTIKDEEGPALPDTHKARLICIEEI